MTQPIVHIVFAVSGGGPLRMALREAGRDDGVVEILHDMNVGLIDPADLAARAKWLEKEMGREGPEDTAPSERGRKEARFPRHRKVAWFTRRSAMEFAGFLDWLWHRGDSPCDTVDLTDVEIAYPPREGPPGPWILPSLALLHPNIIHRNKLWDLARPLPMTERLGYRELWGQRLAENALLRVIEGDKLVSAPISFFDSLLMSHVTDKWQRISGVFSSITVSHWRDGSWQTDDEFLAARMRSLAKRGRIEIVAETGRSFAVGEVRRAQEP